MHTLVYESIAALQLDPVEKKPLFHFFPGTTTLSLGTPGCNFHCTFCQNAHLSQIQPGRGIHGQAIAPDHLVAEAVRVQARSVSYTYSEPTVFFELVRDTAWSAQAAGLANILVSNGFQSPHCLEQLGPHIQAANIDLKSFSNAFYERMCGARLRPVLDNLVQMRSLGWHLELTTLVIPGLNDSDQELTDIASFIYTHLGADIPWHISRFHPCYQLNTIPPTPVATLQHACALGKARGLHFVYGGNIPSAGLEDTICPGCGAVVIERHGFHVRTMRLHAGSCQTCGQQICITKSA
ncbi:AmmeMemoRadiSam system radical SAM enzyme [Desulfovibrionales bacterium]